MKIALVYDRVNKIGGAERVLQAMHEIWPDAPLYTSVYNSKTAKWARKFQVKTSFLQQVPGAKTHHEWLAWAMPYAFESFSFKNYDVVISVTSAEAKGIITRPETLHICYCLTPTRYLWSHKEVYLQGNYATNANFLTKKLTPLVFSKLRQWDYVAAQRPDKMVAISNTVSRRITKYYRRTPDAMIYPPVTAISSKGQQIPDLPTGYYLLVSRLVPYKRIDLAISAFNNLPYKLVIVGEGADKKRLKSLSSDKIIFTGKLPQRKLITYYQHAKGLIFPTEEDFGIVSIEAQSAGKPVVAFKAGGAAETVLDGKTGVLFKEPTPEALINAVNRLERLSISPEACRQQASNFSIAKFNRSLLQFVEESWQKHQQ